MKKGISFQLYNTVLSYCREIRLRINTGEDFQKKINTE